MSESTVAAPASVESTAPAPAATPEAPQAVQGQQDASAGQETRLDRRSAKAAALESVRERFKAAQQAAAGETGATGGGPDTSTQPAAATPVIDATGRAHDPSSGQFTTLPAADAAGSPAPAAVTSQPEPVATQPAAALPQTRRIDLPADHPLREQGLEYLDALDERQERAIRASINSYVRRQEVEAAQREVQEARAEALRYRAWAEAQAAWQTSAVSDGVLQQYEALKEVDPDVAEAFLAGKRLQMDADAQQRYQAAENELQEQHDLQAAAQFVNAAYDSLSAKLPAEVRNLPQYGELYRRAVKQYGADIEAWQERTGQPYEPSETDLQNYLQGALMGDPRVLEVLRGMHSQQTMAQQQEAQRQEQMRLEQIRLDAERRIRAEREQAERERIAAAASQPRHPMGALNGVAVGDAVSMSGAEGRPALLPGRQNKEHWRQQVLARARTYSA